MLAYGFSGVGKTTLLGTAANDPRLWPGLILDFEAGLLSVASKVRWLENTLDAVDPTTRKRIGLDNFIESASKPVPGKLDAIKVSSWADLEDILDLLDHGDLPYKSLLVDSLTEINYLNLREVVEYNYKKTQKGDGELAQLQDYGRSATQMRTIIRGFRDLDMHVIFSILAQDTKDDLTGQKEVKPSLTGKLSEEIPGMCDIMGYIAADQPNSARRMYFQPTQRFRAKDRSEGGKLGEYIDDITLTVILDKLGIEAPPAKQGSVVAKPVGNGSAKTSAGVSAPVVLAANKNKPTLATAAK